MDLKQQLQSYLQKSTDLPRTVGSGTQGAFSGIKSIFTGVKTSDPDHSSVAETTNGWFNQAEKDPIFPSLSKKQRVIGFFLCLLLGTFCFSLASLYLPLLVLKARKFALLYSLGSLFMIGSFSLLWGPVNHMKHLLSGPRLAFTTAYFGSMFATLYFAIWMKSTVLTVGFAATQIFCLVWYIVSYIPGGQTGLKFFSKVFCAAASKTVQKTLPV